MPDIRCLKALALFTWQKWPPGACIAVVALAAAIIPIVTPTELTSIDKAKWIAGLGFLLVLELVIIFKEWKRQDKEFAEDQAKRDAAHFEQMKNLQELRQASEAHNVAVMRQFMRTFPPPPVATRGCKPKPPKIPRGQPQLVSSSNFL
jgi:hypothetical protein